MADITIHDIIGALTVADRKMVELERRASKLSEDISHEWAVIREAKDRAETDREYWKVRSEAMQRQRDEFAVALMSAPHTAECSSWERKGLPSFPCDCWKADRLRNARGILAARDAALVEPLVEAMRRYSQHLEWCVIWSTKTLSEDGWEPCTCGLSAALAPYKTDCADEFPKPPDFPPLFRQTLRGLVPPESLDIVHAGGAGGKKE